MKVWTHEVQPEDEGPNTLRLGQIDPWEHSSVG
jgi:hypothetical protein